MIAGILIDKNISPFIGGTMIVFINIFIVGSLVKKLK
jgi:hypothetical protein